MLRKFLSGVLCAALMLGAFGFSALADEPGAGEAPAAECVAAHVGQYVIGFSYKGTFSGVYDGGPGPQAVVQGTAMPDTLWGLWVPLNIGAFTYSGNEVVPAGNSVTVEVKSMGITTLSGDESTFSFSNSSLVKSVDGTASQLYRRTGYVGTAFITANVNISIAGAEPIPAVLKLSVSITPSPFTFYSSAYLNEASKISAESHVCYYALPTEGVLWMTSENDFTQNLSIETDIGEQPVWEKIDSKTVKITLPEPESNSGYSLHVYDAPNHSALFISSMPEGSCIRIQNGSNEYIVGFAFNEGDIVIISEGNWTYADTTTAEPDPANPRRMFRKMTVDVGLRKVDSNGNAYYEVDKTGPVSVKVLSMEVRHLSGDAETLSFAQEGEQVTRLDEVPDNTAMLYTKNGYAATALVTATVEVTVGGSTQPGTVSVGIDIDRGTNQTHERPANDKTADLNAALAKVAAELPEDGTGFVNFILTADEYDGTIVIPQEFVTKKDYELILQSGTQGTRTKIVGGIDLNGAHALVYSMDFVAPESSGETRAIYNGCSATIQYCTFQGYDVAIDASANTINPHSCVFADNVVAVRVDLPEMAVDSSRNTWTNNNFINNGTAVQVLGLSNFVSPYYFRMVESNFVDNDVTFDVRCPGTIYLYRNYYGETRKSAAAMTSAEILEAIRDGGSGDIQKKPPEVYIADHSSTKAVTNPRWNDPVALDPGIPSLAPQASGRAAGIMLMALALPASTQESGNYLTADWELPTEIVSGEEGLVIDAAAFAGETEEDRVISVVDKDGKVLGIWNFGNAAHEGLTGGFDAQLVLTHGEDGSVTVDVSAAGDLLSALQPTLTIPGAEGGVTHEGGEVSSIPGSDGSPSFVVSGGGQYQISPDTSTKPEEPDEPEDPDDPEDPEKPDTPDVPAEPDEPDAPVTPVLPGAPAVPGTPAEPELSFGDVSEGAWYYDCVAYVCGRGLMDGTSADTFEPDATLTRAMVWAMLARADGKSVTGASWAEDARLWALSCGVSDGTDMNSGITREQFATMLWRYAGSPASEHSLAAYADAASVNSWAADAMAWAVERGIITGVTSDTLSPQGTATRAQAAAMLMRYLEGLA